MSDANCTNFQGDIAMQAIGAIDPASDVALQAHLDGCATCRADAAELPGAAKKMDRAVLAKSVRGGNFNVPKLFWAS